jgi:hypothetical protein
MDGRQKTIFGWVSDFSAYAEKQNNYAEHNYF